jgi:hypothetical protein
MTRNQMGICAVALIALTAAACRGGDTGDTARVAQAEAGHAAAPADTIVVYKTPTCGCCSNWVDHIEEHGFAVVTHDLNDLSETKRQLGVPAGQISCHTATVRGYTIEGHVPADLIRRMLDEQPRGVRGLAVPGMPMGSPGMEGLVKQRYDVLSFDDHGNTEVYAQR